MNKTRTSVAVVIGLVCFAAPAALARELSFEDRVAAQEAIARVTYSHEIGATRPFEEAVPRAALEERVRTYLKQSVALERFWSTPVTAEMLQRELARMAAGSRMPERLLELHAALGNDPLLIQECLARPALVDRLARSFFAQDETIHAGEMQRARTQRDRILRGAIRPSLPHPDRRVVRLVSAGPDKASPERHRGGGATRLELSPPEYASWERRLPDEVGAVGPLENEREAFVTRVVLERKPGEILVASFAVAKRTWQDWWSEVEGALDERPVKAVSPTEGAVPRPPASASSCIPDDTWDNGSLDDLPEARTYHSAVWTGSVMIVWGGSGVAALTDTGGRYDPAIDSWTPTSTEDAPSARSWHSAVWTGAEMIVWGGSNEIGPLSDGGRYDPVTDRWTRTSSVGAPSARPSHTAVWTGSEMIVWGGGDSWPYTDTGGRYDAATDTWTPTSTVGAPSARRLHTAVWTGSRMIVWGGSTVGDGGLYDPVTDRWMPTSITEAPEARSELAAVWTGEEMIVWGGGGYPYTNTGGRYDPSSDSWAPTSTVNAPEARGRLSMTWTGDRMVVWGGIGFGGLVLNTGGRYDPETDSWTPTSTTSAPSARSLHTAVWTGSLMIVWGGWESTGGRYDPATDGWTPTSTGSGPVGREGHSMVWTGSEAIVWGGYLYDGIDHYLRDGGRYDPATDTWAMTSMVGAPSARVAHSAVWTGSEMVVWGGSDPAYLSSGGRYDPMTDTWSPSSIVATPTARSWHLAEWTGSVMVVWGGVDSTGYPKSGGRYDPATDTWAPTSTASAPVGRESFTTIWAGNVMIVWGGYWHDAQGFHFLRNGGRYDPVANTWTPTSTSGAPAARNAHTAVWTGTEMIVWGGYEALNTGGRYNPATNAWTATSTAVLGRWIHTAVWTGREMVVWGGFDPSGQYQSTGSRYEPETDAWVATSTARAPTARISHAAVWTGTTMIVWGGDGGSHLSTGGRYGAGPFLDDDGDGSTVCDDCDDGNPDVYPGAEEVCNGLDDDCDQVVDDGIAAPAGSPALTAGETDTVSELSWTPAAGATGYDVVKGNLGPLRNSGGNFTTTKACLGDDLAVTTVEDTEVPPPTGGLWYLVRAVNACGGDGTYDSEGGSQQGMRDSEIGASANACP